VGAIHLYVKPEAARLQQLSPERLDGHNTPRNICFSFSSETTRRRNSSAAEASCNADRAKPCEVDAHCGAGGNPRPGTARTH
jgi:hypothetical protein